MGAQAPSSSSTPAATPATVPPKATAAPSSATPKAPASVPADHGAATSTKKAAPAKPEKKVDLNNASLAELKTLPTVGDAEAKKIIANRPYKSKGELMTKAGLPEGVYQAVRRKVELQKPRTPAPKK
jgi:DNA uptake protein ComE-like DNA-binding protein